MFSFLLGFSSSLATQSTLTSSLFYLMASSAATSFSLLIGDKGFLYAQLGQYF
jgi:hypothetical protein